MNVEEDAASRKFVMTRDEETLLGMGDEATEEEGGAKKVYVGDVKRIE